MGRAIEAADGCVQGCVDYLYVGDQREREGPEAVVEEGEGDSVGLYECCEKEGEVGEVKVRGSSMVSA